MQDGTKQNTKAEPAHCQRGAGAAYACRARVAVAVSGMGLVRYANGKRANALRRLGRGTLAAGASLWTAVRRVVGARGMGATICRMAVCAMSA